MKKIIFLSVLLNLFQFISVKSQNLVPNPSFEFFTQCPTSDGQTDFAFPWYDPTGATSDYFNACANPSYLGVPNNSGFNCYQPAKTGSAYCGFFSINSGLPNYREYIQVELTDSLIYNVCYYIEFYLSLANTSSYGTNNIGCYISNTAVTTAQPNILNYTPQILAVGNPVINDTVNWVKVSGYYTAFGGEKYITIGNFNTNANTNVAVNDTVTFYPANDTSSYYYVDDVTLIDCSQIGINEIEGNCNFILFPNPASGNLTISFAYNNTKAIVNITDITGKIVLQSEIHNPKSEIDLTGFADGMYFVQIKTGDFTETKKLIVEK